LDLYHLKAEDLVADRRVPLDLVPRGAGADRDHLVRDADKAELRQAPQVDDAGGHRLVVRVDHQIGRTGEHHPVGMGRARDDRFFELAGTQVRGHRPTSRAAEMIASTISW